MRKRSAGGTTKIAPAKIPLVLLSAAPRRSEFVRRRALNHNGRSRTPAPKREGEITMLTHRKVGAVTVAAFQDNVLDQSNARYAERLLTALVGPGSKIVLDLGRAEWMDSSGCCTLITLLKRLKEAGGALKL